MDEGEVQAGGWGQLPGEGGTLAASERIGGVWVSEPGAT